MYDEAAFSCPRGTQGGGGGAFLHFLHFIRHIKFLPQTPFPAGYTTPLMRYLLTACLAVGVGAHYMNSPFFSYPPCFSYELAEKGQCEEKPWCVWKESEGHCRDAEVCASSDCAATFDCGVYNSSCGRQPVACDFGVGQNCTTEPCLDYNVTDCPISRTECQLRSDASGSYCAASNERQLCRFAEWECEHPCTFDSDNNTCVLREFDAECSNITSEHDCYTSDSCDVSPDGACVPSQCAWLSEEGCTLRPECAWSGECKKMRSISCNDVPYKACARGDFPDCSVNAELQCVPCKSMEYDECRVSGGCVWNMSECASRLRCEGLAEEACGGGLTEGCVWLGDTCFSRETMPPCQHLGNASCAVAMQLDLCALEEWCVPRNASACEHAGYRTCRLHKGCEWHPQQEVCAPLANCEIAEESWSCMWLPKCTWVYGTSKCISAPNPCQHNSYESCLVSPLCYTDGIYSTCMPYVGCTRLPKASCGSGVHQSSVACSWQNNTCVTVEAKCDVVDLTSPTCMSEGKAAKCSHINAVWSRDAVRLGKPFHNGMFGFELSPGVSTYVSSGKPFCVSEDGCAPCTAGYVLNPSVTVVCDASGGTARFTGEVCVLMKHVKEEIEPNCEAEQGAWMCTRWPTCQWDGNKCQETPVCFSPPCSVPCSRLGKDDCSKQLFACAFDGTNGSCIDEPCLSKDVSSCASDSACIVRTADNAIAYCAASNERMLCRKQEHECDDYCQWSWQTSSCELRPFDDECGSITDKARCYNETYCDYDSNVGACVPLMCRLSASVASCAARPYCTSQAPLPGLCWLKQGSELSCADLPLKVCLTQGGDCALNASGDCIDCAKLSMQECGVVDRCAFNNTVCIGRPGCSEQTSPDACNSDLTEGCFWLGGKCKPFDEMPSCEGVIDMALCMSMPQCSYGHFGCTTKRDPSCPSFDRRTCKVNPLCEWDSVEIKCSTKDVCSSQEDSDGCKRSACTWVRGADVCTSSQFPCDKLMQHECNANVLCHFSQEDGCVPQVGCTALEEEEECTASVRPCQWTNAECEHTGKACDYVDFSHAVCIVNGEAKKCALIGAPWADQRVRFGSPLRDGQFGFEMHPDMPMYADTLKPLCLGEGCSDPCRSGSVMNPLAQVRCEIEGGTVQILKELCIMHAKTGADGIICESLDTSKKCLQFRKCEWAGKQCVTTELGGCWTEATCKDCAAPAHNAPCQRHGSSLPGTCVQDGGMMACKEEDAFEDDCFTSPCKNRLTCHDADRLKNQKYECLCDFGYKLQNGDCVVDAASCSVREHQECQDKGQACTRVGNAYQCARPTCTTTPCNEMSCTRIESGTDGCNLFPCPSCLGMCASVEEEAKCFLASRTQQRRLMCSDGACTEDCPTPRYTPHYTLHITPHHQTVAPAQGPAAGTNRCRSVRLAHSARCTLVAFLCVQRSAAPRTSRGVQRRCRGSAAHCHWASLRVCRMSAPRRAALQHRGAATCHTTQAKGTRRTTLGGMLPLPPSLPPSPPLSPHSPKSPCGVHICHQGCSAEETQKCCPPWGPAHSCQECVKAGNEAHCVPKSCDAPRVCKPTMGCVYDESTADTCYNTCGDEVCTPDAPCDLKKCASGCMVSGGEPVCFTPMDICGTCESGLCSVNATGVGVVCVARTPCDSKVCQAGTACQTRNGTATCVSLDKARCQGQCPSDHVCTAARNNDAAQYSCQKRPRDRPLCEIDSCACERGVLCSPTETCHMSHTGAICIRPSTADPCGHILCAPDQTCKNMAGVPTCRSSTPTRCTGVICSEGQECSLGTCQATPVCNPPRGCSTGQRCTLHYGQPICVPQDNCPASWTWLRGACRMDEDCPEAWICPSPFSTALDTLVSQHCTCDPLTGNEDACSSQQHPTLRKCVPQKWSCDASTGNFSDAQREWCCEYRQIACDAYHCTPTGYEGPELWSADKRAACCADTNGVYGCALPSTPVNVTHDCYSPEQWTFAKRVYCCNVGGVQCPAPQYDCHAPNTSSSEWSDEQQAYCCEAEQQVHIFNQCISS